MGLILQAVIHTTSRLPGAKYVAKWKWGHAGFKGLGAAASMAAGGHYAYHNYGHDYGHGITAAYAVASVFPVTSISLILAEGGKNLGDAVYYHQRSKRQSSFTKSAVADKFGTIDRMRQHSIQQLSRDHTSKQRVMGNEAYYLHR
jgi:hypothetical protein